MSHDNLIGTESAMETLMHGPTRIGLSMRPDTTTSNQCVTQASLKIHEVRHSIQGHR